MSEFTGVCVSVCQCVPIKLSHSGVHPRASQSRRVPCAKTVPESEVFMPLGLALSEKQIPQITETKRSRNREWNCWSRSVRAQGRRASGLLECTGQRYGRLAIRAARVGPEADTLLKSWVGMIPHGIVEKIREQLGTLEFLSISFQFVMLPLISSNSLQIHVYHGFDPQRPKHDS